jgi:hypothetical protein
VKMVPKLNDVIRRNISVHQIKIYMLLKLQECEYNEVVICLITIQMVINDIKKIMDGCSLIWVTSLALAIFGLVKSHKTLTCNHDEVIHSRSFPPFFFFGKGLVSPWIKIALYWS